MEEIITDGAGTLSIHEHEGQFGVYEEWKPGDLTKHEFPNSEEAEAYIEQVRQIDVACNQIHRDYHEMVVKWIDQEPKEVGVSPHLVLEFIGGIPVYLSKDLKKEDPADGVTEQRSEEKVMQETPNSPITIVPSITGTDGARHPRHVGLTMRWNSITATVKPKK